MPLAYIDGMMQLYQYMTENGLNDEEVATDLGVSRATVTRWRNRSMRPSWPTTQRIEQWSGGVVSPNDWAEMYR